MKITDEMLMAAVVKAVEAGLLSRRSLREELAEARQLMREILTAALVSSPLTTSASRRAYRRTLHPYPLRNEFPDLATTSRSGLNLVLDDKAEDDNATHYSSRNTQQP